MDVTTNALDLSLLAQELFQRTLALTAMASGSIWLRAHDELECLAHYPEQPARPSPDPIITRVVASGRPEFADTHGEGPPHPTSATVLPLVAGGEVIGALALGGGRCDLPRDWLEAIASQVAGAIRQAQLAEQVETQQRELQALKRQQDELISIISHELKNPI
jgi:GAF domain-containing protein